MGEALGRGMVLVMSLWDDPDAHMLWLDSDYPVNKDPSVPGVHRGTCSRSTGDPKDVESQNPNSSVKYMNIKVGHIGSTSKYEMFLE
jgi:cellulose 1,4-beta-cellobiosidase